MNRYEYIAQQDSGMLDSAYRIFRDIKEDKDIGIVGPDLRNKWKDRFNLLNELRKSVSDRNVEQQIYKLIEKIEGWYKWEST